jgi:ribonuclease VapC
MNKVCRDDGGRHLRIDGNRAARGRSRQVQVRLGGGAQLLISAVTVAEALIVAARRNLAEEMNRLIDGLGFEIVSVTPAAARRIAASYARWGREHSAGLNFGDCFSYEIAKEHSCPLLYVGEDFAKTDLESAI